MTAIEHGRCSLSCSSYQQRSPSHLATPDWPSAHVSACCQVCLELVIAVTLRNRDRVMLMWSLVHDYLALIMAPEAARRDSPLIARAALGLLRVCQRLLPYKADCAPPLLRSLQLLLRLNATVAWDLATRLADEV